MATQLFFRNTFSDYATGNNDANLRGTASNFQSNALDTARGASATSQATNTAAGPNNGVEVAGGTIPFAWYSPPLDAAVTISGSITWNLRAAESSNSANVAINGRLEVIDGATGVITLIDATARITELGLTTEAANNFAETPAAGVACKRGDRLRVRVYGDDAGTMGSGFTFTFWYNGPTAAASGDSYLTLTETLAFAAEPAGTQIFPTDTASAVATASNDKEAWTTRGAGVATTTTNTVAGWTAPIQVTDTAGGTVVDWFTRPLAAFTLGGAVRVNARGLTGGGGGVNVAHRCEIAVTAGDGSGAVVWAATTFWTRMINIEVAQSFLVSGTNVAITDGQRLRIRFSIDDGMSGGAMLTGFTATLFYAGAAAATGDTYCTFTQTLTELVAANPPHVSPYPQILAH